MLIIKIINRTIKSQLLYNLTSLWHVVEVVRLPHELPDNACVGLSASQTPGRIFHMYSLWIKYSNMIVYSASNK